MRASAATALLAAAAAFPLLAQPFGAARSEFRVNTSTTGSQQLPSVAYDASGSFLVVWDGGAGTVDEVQGQRYVASLPTGTEFRVNTFTTAFQYEAHVAGSRGGSGPTYVVVWTSRTSFTAMAARAGISRRNRPAPLSSMIGRSPNKSARTLRQISVSGPVLLSAAAAIAAPNDNAANNSTWRQRATCSAQKTGIRSVLDICAILPGRLL